MSWSVPHLHRHLKDGESGDADDRGPKCKDEAVRRADRRRLPLRSRHGHEPHRRDRVGDYVERVDRIGEGGDEVREGGEDDVEREEESRQIWTRKRACKNGSSYISRVHTGFN